MAGWSDEDAEIKPGEILAGKYRVDGVLGAGGMGIVVAAHHVQLDERFAIKLVLPSALKDATVVARFAQEARAAAKIKSEHVARVFDVGTLENGSPYLVMEFLEGTDLANWLVRKGPLPVELAVDLILQACEALVEAHGLGIIHRDLKPSNLFVVRDSDGRECVKILDFGISKVMASSTFAPNMAMTTTNAVLGSPLYMSPEQMAGARTVDFRTDIWSLGIILYELLTGKRPFMGNTLPEVCMKVATQDPAQLWESRPDAPPGLEMIILKCLAKDRDRRYRNMVELARALAPFASSRAQPSLARIARLAESVPSPDPRVEGLPALGTAITGPTSTWVRTGFGTVGGRTALGLLLALLLALGVAFVFRRSAHRDGAAGVRPEVSTATAHPAQPPPGSEPAASESAPAATAPPSSAVAPRPLSSASAPLSSGPRPRQVAPPRRGPGATAPAHSAATTRATATAVTPQPDCDPPFTVDSAGIKRPKPECL